MKKNTKKQKKTNKIGESVFEQKVMMNDMEMDQQEVAALGKDQAWRPITSLEELRKRVKPEDVVKPSSVKHKRDHPRPDAMKGSPYYSKFNGVELLLATMRRNICFMKTSRIRPTMKAMSTRRKSHRRRRRTSEAPFFSSLFESSSSSSVLQRGKSTTKYIK